MSDIIAMRRIHLKVPVQTREIAQMSEIDVSGSLESAGREDAAGVDSTMQVVSFKVGEEHYGIDIQQVREIRAWQVATQLPNTPAFVRGVINLRGTIVPILDLRARFGQGTTETGTANVVIV